MKHQSAIEELLFNQCGVAKIKTNDEGREIMAKLSAIELFFEDVLREDPAVAARFAEYKQLQDDLNSAETILYFKEGFRFGVRLGLDVADRSEQADDDGVWE